MSTHPPQSACNYTVEMQRAAPSTSEADEPRPHECKRRKATTCHSSSPRAKHCTSPAFQTAAIHLYTAFAKLTDGFSRPNIGRNRTSILQGRIPDHVQILHGPALELRHRRQALRPLILIQRRRAGPVPEEPGEIGRQAAEFEVLGVEGEGLAAEGEGDVRGGGGAGVGGEEACEGAGGGGEREGEGAGNAGEEGGGGGGEGARG